MVFLRADTLEGWGACLQELQRAGSGGTKGQNKLKWFMADKHGGRMKCMMIEAHAS